MSNREIQPKQPESSHIFRKLVGGVALTGMLGVTAVGYYDYHTTHLPVSTIAQSSEALICAAELAQDCTESTALAVQSTGRLAYKVGINDIPVFAQNAIIAEEDRGYYGNYAVDISKSLARIIVVDSPLVASHAVSSKLVTLDTPGIQGGSGIPNQLAGILYPNKFPSDPVAEEIYDDILGLRLEQEYSKQQVLGMYLNDVQLGGGAVGIGAANEALFGEPVTDMTVEVGSEKQLGEERYTTKIDHEEKLILDIEMTDNPQQYSLNTSRYKDPKMYNYIFGKMQKIRNKYYHVINAMVNTGTLSSEDATADKATLDSDFYFTKSDTSHQRPTGVNVNKIPFIPYLAPSNSDYRIADAVGAHAFVDFATAQAKVDLGLKPDDALPNGTKIITTLSLADQAALEASVHDPANEASVALAQTKGLDIGAISLRQDGSIAANIGSKNYADLSINLALGTLGGGSGRAAGSQNKIDFLAVALAMGWTLDKELEIPKSIVVNNPGGKPYVVSSGQGCEFLDNPNPPCKLTVAQAFAYSSNMLPAMIINQFGLPAVIKVMQALGQPVDSTTGPSVMLGVGQFSPLLVDENYNDLGLNQGHAVAAYAILRIVGIRGQTLWQHHQPSAGTAVVPKSATVAVAQAAKGVTKFGTARNRFTDIPEGIRSVGGKTGTSDAIAGSQDTNTDLGFTDIACGLHETDVAGINDTGNQATSIWIGYPAGSIPIYAIETSGELAAINSDYLQRRQVKGQSCDVAAVNYR